MQQIIAASPVTDVLNHRQRLIMGDPADADGLIFDLRFPQRPDAQESKIT